jgi:hypothetical protein
MSNDGLLVAICTTVEIPVTELPSGAFWCRLVLAANVSVSVSVSVSVNVSDLLLLLVLVLVLLRNPSHSSLSVATKRHFRVAGRRLPFS